MVQQTFEVFRLELEVLVCRIRKPVLTPYRIEEAHVRSPPRRETRAAGELAARRPARAHAAEQLDRLLEPLAETAHADHGLGERGERESLGQPHPALELRGIRPGSLAAR